MRKGFTLVELSIVLVIIGLLIGAVVGGTSLIKASKVQSVVSDFAKYKDAMVKFNQKYYYWPGDQPDATDRWSGVSNGDGDGKVEGCGSSDICGNGEVYQAMKILALERFIPGTYSGTGPAAPVTSFPASQADPVEGSFLTSPIYVILYDSGLVAKNALFITDINNTTLSSALPANQSSAVDAKMDDGVASTGIVLGFGIGGTCRSGSSYDLSNTTNACVVAITLD